jgi:DNA-binding transcriptional ArsR family regulator
MSKKYLLLSLDDSRLKPISEILGNKTASKIINFLSEKEEASEKDISKELSIPINTVEYNLKKMTKMGIVEESKRFFWSPKGRKIKMYRFSNKSIIISPKNITLNSSIKQIIPVALISGVVSIAIRYYFVAKQSAQNAMLETASLAADASLKTGDTVNIINTGDYFLWFIGGALLAIFALVLKMILYEKSWGEK